MTFNLFYAGKSATEAGPDAPAVQVPRADETTPEFRDIHISNITCNGAASAIFINGLEEKPVKDISFTDVMISSRKGIEITNADEITFQNVTVRTPGGQETPVVRNSTRITFN